MIVRKCYLCGIVLQTEELKKCLDCETFFCEDCGNSETEICSECKPRLFAKDGQNDTEDQNAEEEN